jgi:hypothetical protein
VLAQICVVTTYWCVFTLGSAIIGPAHAMMAVLLMVGIALLTVPSPDFGPPILAMALWALALSYLWQAVVQKRKRSWYVLGVAAALLFLTTDAALILIGTLVAITALTERGRSALDTPESWIVGIALTPFLFVHLLWLEGVVDSVRPVFERLRLAVAAGDNTVSWVRLLIALALAHAGLVILVVLASGWPRARAMPAPPLTRREVDAFAKTYVKVCLIVPALLATVIAVVIGRSLPIGGATRGLVRARGGHGRREQHRALSSARARFRLGRALDRARRVHTAIDRAAAVGGRNRSESRAAGKRDGTFFRR